MSSMHPVERTLFLMKRWRRRDEAKDAGTWRGLSVIAQGVGSDRDAVRGYLIKLVARGEVEAMEFANGVFWRAQAAGGAA